MSWTHFMLTLSEPITSQTRMTHHWLCYQPSPKYYMGCTLLGRTLLLQNSLILTNIVHLFCDKPKFHPVLRHPTSFQYTRRAQYPAWISTDQWDSHLSFSPTDLEQTQFALPCTLHTYLENKDTDFRTLSIDYGCTLPCCARRSIVGLLLMKTTNHMVLIPLLLVLIERLVTEIINCEFNNFIYLFICVFEWDSAHWWILKHIKMSDCSLTLNR